MYGAMALINHRFCFTNNHPTGYAKCVHKNLNKHFTVTVTSHLHYKM